MTGNSGGISDHFTGRSALTPRHGVLAPLGTERLLSRPAEKGSHRTRNFGPFFRLTGPLFEAQDPVSAARETGLFCPSGCQKPLVWGLPTCNMLRNSLRKAVKKSPKIPNPARKPTLRIFPPSSLPACGWRSRARRRWPPSATFSSSFSNCACRCARTQNLQDTDTLRNPVVIPHF